MYSNKYKCYAFSGIIITRKEVRIFTIREQLCILMKHDDFKGRNLNVFKFILECTMKIVRTLCSEILKRSIMSGSWNLSRIIEILQCMQQLNRIYILFWRMGMNSIMIDLLTPRTNQVLEVILIKYYINKDGCGRV